MAKSNLRNVTCIGGGHGLGHLLSVMYEIEGLMLTGIVCTTDNGGSTGRLREQSDSIAWGDIRYCLSKLSDKQSTKSLLFEYRFDNLGELSGHSLGNLMCCAVDSLCIRPTDSVKVMREFLGVNVEVLPMSDHATHLIATLTDGSYVYGELNVDHNAVKGLDSLALSPAVDASPEVLLAIAKSEIILLGPGSFYTSVLPNLLVNNVIDAINGNKKLKIWFIVNVEAEFDDLNHELDRQIEFIHSIGIMHPISLLIPRTRSGEAESLNVPFTILDVDADTNGRHQASQLKAALSKLLFD
ncbi:uridine diphosphate-N-acetylglucosamine-binding protein YvcK [Thalassotalea sp. M1531]|uniref:Uridine diphosphate-N-acetylglucosamine-binding protein YvcK n=1 Tax=Thalassotalea algicola TaxID=2716224 RepID=A0A7Y0LDE1_9GAMM|nr:uridine diphosphate-N-acetylglucosamine-binding protein YvcK [Thalassotalea algicola]NMP32097.1 uridine diphosphate-N-acetylglucosamine-binding protein YvcK [Thalassotalea algicola]